MLIEELIRILGEEESGKAPSPAVRARMLEILAAATDDDAAGTDGSVLGSLEMRAAFLQDTLDPQLRAAIEQRLSTSPSLREQLELEKAWLDRLELSYGQAPETLIERAAALAPRRRKVAARVPWREWLGPLPAVSLPLAFATAAVTALFFGVTYWHISPDHKAVTVASDEPGNALGQRDAPWTSLGLGTGKGAIVLLKVPMSSELGRLIVEAKAKNDADSRASLVSAIERAARLPRPLRQGAAVEIQPGLYAQIDSQGKSPLTSIAVAIQNGSVLILGPGD